MRQLLAISKALGDESRLRALATLQDGELCLCQIIEVLGLSPSTVSKHMSVLQQSGLVQRRKEGKWHYYRLATADTGVDAHHRDVARAALAWALGELRDDATIRRDALATREVRRRDLEELSACYRS